MCLAGQDASWGVPANYQEDGDALWGVQRDQQGLPDVCWGGQEEHGYPDQWSPDTLWADGGAAAYIQSVFVPQYNTPVLPLFALNPCSYTTVCMFLWCSCLLFHAFFMFYRKTICTDSLFKSNFI